MCFCPEDVLLFFEQVWNPHFFVLTATKLHYTEETNPASTNDDDDEDNDVNTKTEARTDLSQFTIE